MLDEMRDRYAHGFPFGWIERFSGDVYRVGICSYYFFFATRRRALLARGFFSISASVGVIGFFVMISRVHGVMSCPVIGSMMASDFSRKKCFTIRSSPE